MSWDRFGYPASPGADAARAMAGGFANQLDDYVLPRLRDADAPLLAVVGGSTGSGKSTLVNRLVGTPVTTPGVAADNPPPGARPQRR